MAVIGVMGGSYNPVHNGHIAVARKAVADGLVDKVLMVLSPRNPLKETPELLADDADRMEMLRIACEPYDELEACDIELSMPRPSYTIDTLRLLSEKNPADTFRLIIGADNWDCFRQWRSPEEILLHYAPIVYPRSGFGMPDAASGVTPLQAPMMDISSTMIRERLIKDEPVDNLLPAAVLDYIKDNKLWTPTL